MNRLEFLNILKSKLSGINQNELNEILSDYEEHFQVGLENGETEENIAKNLGDPIQIANLFKADYLVEKASTSTSFNSVFKAVLAFLSLSLFNLIVVLGPFLLILGILFSLWIGVVSIACIGGAGIIFGIVSPFLNILSIYATVSSVLFIIFLSFALLCTGILGAIGMFYLTKWFLSITVKYLKFNLELIS